MDPISAGIGAIGLGFQIFGGMSASDDANQAAGIQRNITGLEGKVNDQRRNQMEFEARRQQLEVYRNNQRARAMATNSAVNQGAQFGTGLQGGLAQINAQSETNSLGISGNLEIGRNIFGINNQISGQKMALSGVQSQMATDQGYASLGASITKSAGTLSAIGQSAGGIFGKLPLGFGGPYV